MAASMNIHINTHNFQAVCERERKCVWPNSSVEKKNGQHRRKTRKSEEEKEHIKRSKALDESSAKRCDVQIFSQTKRC